MSPSTRGAALHGQRRARVAAGAGPARPRGAHRRWAASWRTATLPLTDPGRDPARARRDPPGPGRAGPDRRAALGGHPRRAADARGRARAGLGGGGRGPGRADPAAGGGGAPRWPTAAPSAGRARSRGERSPASPAQTELADLLRRSHRRRRPACATRRRPALRRVRQRIRDLRREIVKRLEAYFGAPDADTTFQERYVTVRHGRYVLPIRAEAKGRLRGIVHDRSQSGATLFVEPEAVVEANNDLVQATREEETEILRILAALTDAVRAALPELDDAGRRASAALDLIFARGALAERMEAVEPAIDRRARRLPARRAATRCCSPRAGQRAGGRAVIPMDIEIDARAAAARHHRPERGRQDGGAQDPRPARADGAVGLPRARARRARACPSSRRCFAIVGDDQSVAENLSTFSAFVKQLRDVLERVDDRSLVLLDELGAGTDPDDGAALAQAVLEDAGRARRGGAWPRRTSSRSRASPPRIRGPATPRSSSTPSGSRPPSGSSTIGPGQSYALSIGARLGLPAALIERAHAHRSTQQRQLQELLARLDDRDRTDAERAARSSGARRRARACSRGPRPSSRRRAPTARETRRPGQGGGPAAGHRGATARQRGVGPPQARREEPRRSSSARASGCVETAQRVEQTAGAAAPAPDAAGAGRRRAIASRSRISASRARCWRWTARRPRCRRAR